MDAVAGPRQLAEGTMLDDKYRIERLLAVGGMGAVYVGTHIKLRKKVAIKVLNPQLTSDAMLQRFHREAITASQIGHEGIAQVTDLGTSQAGEAFLVMELLEGESLAHRLKTAGPLPIELACELGCAILSPLDAAHRAGIVHRDLKPDNVFLVRQSRGELVKLLDFGISRASGLEGEFRLTNTGVVMGTPYYMSPEQARGDSEVTHAADLYSFGVMLYEMLVGRVPITGENYNQLIFRVMTGEFEAPRIRRPDIPEQLEALILRAMALDPGNRPGSAAELEHALLAFCRAGYREHMIERISSAGIPWGTPPPTTRPPITNPPYVPAGTDPTLLAPSGMIAPAAQRRSKLPWLVAGLLVVGGGIAVALALQGGDDTKPAEVAEQPVAVAAPTAPVAAPTPPPAVTPPPATPSTITLKFTVEPTSATIAIDGKPIDGREHVVAKDADEHEVSITAPGFVRHAEKLRFDETQRIVVNLVRERVKTTPPKGGIKRLPKSGERIDTSSPYD